MMKLYKILLTTAIVTFLTTAVAFAAPESSSKLGPDFPQQKSSCTNREMNHFKKKDGKQQDPIKALESRKEKIQTLLKEGKITKEKADELNTKIGSKIKEIKEFDNLSVKQKKDKLTSNFKTSLEKRVKEGKLTQDEADKLLKKFTEKLGKWDGKGYPQFHGKEFKPGKKPDSISRCQ